MSDARPPNSMHRFAARPADGPAPGTLPAWWLPAASAALLMAGLHACLAISASRGQVAGWLPHFDGNCSVSKACRNEPAIHVFRALVLPSSVLLALTWWVAAQWLGERELATVRFRRWVVGLGLTGALFLILYATFLGTQGDVYSLMRRYGIYVFFGGTSIVELMLTLALSRAAPERVPELERWVLRTLQLGMLFMLAAGPVNIVAAKVLDHEAVANVLEWWFGITMAGSAALLARIWRRAHLTLSVARDPPNGVVG